MTKRSFCNQTRWVKLDADFPPSGSSLQAFQHFVTMQSQVASRFSDFGTSAEDDRERDAVADCTVVGGVHRAAEAGILFEVDVSHPMVVVFD